MAQVKLIPGILSISGRIGKMIYRSRKQPDGSYKVFVHEAPKKRHWLEPFSVQLRSVLGPTSRDNTDITQYTMLKITKQQLDRNLGKAIHFDATLKDLNKLIFGWFNYHHYGHQYREAVRHRKWLYITEVHELSDYAGYDLTKNELWYFPRRRFHCRLRFLLYLCTRIENWSTKDRVNRTLNINRT